MTQFIILTSERIQNYPNNLNKFDFFKLLPLFLLLLHNFVSRKTLKNALIKYFLRKYAQPLMKEEKCIIYIMIHSSILISLITISIIFLFSYYSLFCPDIIFISMLIRESVANLLSIELFLKFLNTFNEYDPYIPTYFYKRTWKMYFYKLFFSK